MKVEESAAGWERVAGSGVDGCELVEAPGGNRVAGLRVIEVSEDMGAFLVLLLKRPGSVRMGTSAGSARSRDRRCETRPVAARAPSPPRPALRPIAKAR